MPARSTVSVAAPPQPQVLPDAVTLLVVVGALLLLLPAQLVVANIGIATPALFAALVCGWLWAMGRVADSDDMARGRQPVRIGLLVYGVAILASYAASASLGLTPDQAQGADRGIVVTMAMVGLALYAADGIRDRARLDRLLESLVVCGTGVAVVGIVQFTIGWDTIETLRIPGLTSMDLGYEAITTRSDFSRVAGTMLHPIEFSVVLTMLLPFALHYAFTRRNHRWWIPVVLIGVAIPMSVSRTAVVAIAAIAVVLVPTWPREWLRGALVLGLAMAVGLKAMIPGLIGTLRALLFSYGADPSIASRHRGSGAAWTFIDQHPLFGRGYGSFIPQRFFFLDNQYMLTIIETGFVGLCALLVLFGCAIHAARAARRASTDLADRHLGQCLVASLVAALVACGTFDFLSFPSARGLAFLFIGISGAFWRLQRQHRVVRSEPVSP
jgi:O-antigen ligase